MRKSLVFSSGFCPKGSGFLRLPGVDYFAPMSGFVRLPTRRRGGVLSGRPRLHDTTPRPVAQGPNSSPAAPYSALSAVRPAEVYPDTTLGSSDARGARRAAWSARADVGAWPCRGFPSVRLLFAGMCATPTARWGGTKRSPPCPPQGVSESRTLSKLAPERPYSAFCPETVSNTITGLMRAVRLLWATWARPGMKVSRLAHENSPPLRPLMSP